MNKACHDSEFRDYERIWYYMAADMSVASAVKWRILLFDRISQDAVY